MGFAFLFATCRKGSEAWLKSEISDRHGELLSPAFARPQLLTWKARAALDASFVPDLCFARSWALSLGTAPEPAALPDLWTRSLDGPLPFRWDLGPRLVPEDGVPPSVWSLADAAAAPLPVDPESPWIAEAIGEFPESGPLLLGARLRSAPGPACPLGISRAVLPPDAPSRAWLKVEQGLAWAGWDSAARWSSATPLALDLGSSPGGISLALVRRGFRVEAVDPSPMDARVLAAIGPGEARVTHRRVAVGDYVGRENVPRPVDLLVSDMNLAPPVVLRALERIQARVRARRWIITLKLNDDAMVRRLPAFRERVRQFAPAPVRIVQLPANRREVTILAGV
jgi:23S rRNA (cytidine2498-2'-O)-methyltransferase